MAALKGRYQFGRLNQNLKEEKPWIISVHDAFQKRLAGLSPISQYRLKLQLEWYQQAVQPEAGSEDAGE
jgi:hypothetical protein